jgi:hypothetical protein
MQVGEERLEPPAAVDMFACETPQDHAAMLGQDPADRSGRTAIDHASDPTGLAAGRSAIYTRRRIM